MKSLYLLLFLFVAVACTETVTEQPETKVDSSEVATEEVEMPEIETSAVDSSFMGLLKPKETEAILKAYYQMKDDLIASDAQKVQTSAAELVKAYPDSVPQLDSVIILTTLIRESSVLEDQRRMFKPLSEQLYPILVANKTAETGTMYLQFCPMALDYEGGEWISNSDEVVNPYFGDEMLHCGSIHEKF